jgi:hypothetical protein
LEFNRNMLRSQYYYYRRWYRDRLIQALSSSGPTAELQRNFVFLHIPKAGGSSTRDFFKRVFPARYMYPEPRLGRFPEYESLKTKPPQVFMSHLGYRFAQEANAIKATLLRHPVERLLSLYSYSVNPGKRRALIGGLPADMSLMEFLQSPLPAVKMNIDNAQCWQLAYGYSHRERRLFCKEHSAGDILPLALANLDRIEHLGVIEQFELFKTQILDCYGGPAEQSSKRVNVTEQRLQYSELSDEERVAVDDYVRLDMALYEAVLGRL